MDHKKNICFVVVNRDNVVIVFENRLVWEVFSAWHKSHDFCHFQHFAVPANVKK